MPITVQMGEGTLVQNRALSTMERVAPNVTKRTRPVAAVLAVIAETASEELMAMRGVKR